jgi:dihydropteroate synthase
MKWQTTRFTLDLTRPQVMGIVNVTPDSFSPMHSPDSVIAVRHAELLLKQGADILDIGGESSRPGAQPVTLEEEWARIGPVLREVIQLGCPVSVDTTKPEIMQRALDLGVDILNDIHAFSSTAAQKVAIAHDRCGMCLMHMQGEPHTMQTGPSYNQVVTDVTDFLRDRTQTLVSQGVSASRLVIDPGIGFGKTVDHNFTLLAQQQALLPLGYGVLVGWSRKSSLGAVTGRPVDQRLGASVAAALLAVQNGAHVVRVHDVADTVDALKVWQRIHPQKGSVD